MFLMVLYRSSSSVVVIKKLTSLFCTLFTIKDLTSSISFLNTSNSYIISSNSDWLG